MWNNISVLLFLEKLYYFSSLLILIFSNANKSIFTLEMLIFRYSDSIYVRMIRHSVSVPIVSSEYIYFSQLVLFKSVFQNFSVVFFFFFGLCMYQMLRCINIWQTVSVIHYKVLQKAIFYHLEFS